MLRALMESEPLASTSDHETRLDSVVAVVIAQKSVVSILSNGFGL